MGLFRPNIDKLVSQGNRQGILKALRHRDAGVRAEALDGMRLLYYWQPNLGWAPNDRARHQEEILDELCRHLSGDDQVALRQQTARLLGRLGGKAALPSLFDALRRQHDVVLRKTIEESIHAIGAQQPAALAEIMKHRDGSHAVFAATVLGSLRDESTIPALIAALGDERHKVRQAASAALREIGQPGVGPLIKALGQRDARVRQGAEDLLGQLSLNDAEQRAVDEVRAERQRQAEEKAARDRLRNLLKQGRLDEIVGMGPEVVMPLARYRAKFTADEEPAAAALAQIRDPEAVEPLVEVLDDRRGEFQESVRMAAAEALGAIACERAVDALRGQLDVESSMLRITVIEALGRSGDRRAVGALLELLNDESNYLRKAAAAALGHLGDQRAIEPLARVLRDEDTILPDGRAEYKFAVEEALLRLGDDSLLERFIAALRDPGSSEEERWQSLDRLAKSRDRRHAELIIDVLFERPYLHAELRPMFEDYTDAIMSAARCYDETCETSGREWEEITVYEHTVRPEALASLCALKTPLADTLLHKVAGRADLQVLQRTGDMIGDSYRTLGLEPVRKHARQELERRGNPAPIPEVLLDDAAWRLGKS